MHPRVAVRQFGSRTGQWPLLAAALIGVAACAHRPSSDVPAALRFSNEVREILARPSPEFYDARSRLEAMGPEVDAVLVELARDPATRPLVRANALILLADRKSDAALPTLRRALLSEEMEMLRAAAVLGLQRLSSASESAASLIRSAVGDPSRTVRINALQALDIREVATMRALLRVEDDPEVRQVAMQLIALAESRGAPLALDREGKLRTTGFGTDPQLAFRPAGGDPVEGQAVGELHVALPLGRDLLLSDRAEVVGGVLPAFFSPDRSKVVYEAERQIRVLNLTTREQRALGPGVAPRLIPFTHQFVFLREVPGGREEITGGTRIRYEVVRAGFIGDEVEVLGELAAEARPGRHANYSPVRWMVVGDTPQGMVLRGDGIRPFLLPAPVWRPSPSESGGAHGLPFLNRTPGGGE